MTEPEERLLYLLQSAVASLIIKVTSQTDEAPREYLGLMQDGVNRVMRFTVWTGATSVEGANDKM
jgi:hypothetical protein